jgi:activator of HSP90 ATPase
MKSFRQEYQIEASVEDVFDALTNPKTIEKWSGVPAKMENKIGGVFNLWDGFIYGTNTDVIENKKLVQNWYSRGWEQPSKVTIDLSEREDKTTTLVLNHENVPLDSEYDFEIGWKKYYMGKIIVMFGRN